MKINWRRKLTQTASEAIKNQPDNLKEKPIRHIKYNRKKFDWNKYLNSRNQENF